MKYSKKVYILVILIFIGFSVFLSRKIEVVVNYDVVNNEQPSGLTTLYFDNGNGFEEDDSVYISIDEGHTRYVFTPRYWVEGIKIIPTREPGQAVYLNDIEIYVDNILIKDFDNKEVFFSILQKQSAALVTFENGLLKIEYKETEPWPYLTFSGNFVDQMNKISYMTLVRMIFCIGVVVLPVVIRMGIKKIIGDLGVSKGGEIAYLLLVIIVWIVQDKIPNIIIALIGFLPFLFIDIREIYGRGGNAVLYMISFLISAFLMPYSIDALNSQFSIFSIYFVLNSWICILSMWFFLQGSGAEINENSKLSMVPIFIYAYVIVCITFGIYEITKNFMTVSQNLFYAGVGSIPRLTSPIFLMNYLWGFLFISLLIGVFGIGGGSVLYGIVFLVLFVGNIIKIHYHNTLLTPLDFLQIKEMFGIAYTMLGVKKILLMIICFALLVCILVKMRRYYCQYFKWNKRYLVIAIVTCVPLFCYSKAVIGGEYKELGIFYKGYENEFVNEKSDGVAFYNLINFANLQEIIMKEPDNYTKEYVETLKSEFVNIVTNTTFEDEKPNVILIMAESLFDIENIDEVSFSSPVLPTLKQYQKGTLISPRYGGYTSAVEYEALTGLSLAFYPSALVPYTTYFNQRDKMVPSVVQEFNNNGYETYAIHPNEKTFYNRDVAYEMLGFKTFLDKTAFEFTEDNTVAGQFLKDGPIGEKIISLIEENDNPIFAFAVTIAGHYMEEDRYQETTIDVQSDKLDESELNDLKQAATAYHETDEMFDNLINYLEDCSEPTLVYIFGDHLPPLPAFNKLNYTQNLYNKYGTFLAAYSNYKDIIFPEYVTPNQLAPQMLIDSGADYSSYYNYIYKLREQYPVIQKEFCNVDEIPEMQIYRTIQYDIMFGNQWFYEGK